MFREEKEAIYADMKRRWSESEVIRSCRKLGFTKEMNEIIIWSWRAKSLGQLGDCLGSRFYSTWKFTNVDGATFMFTYQDRWIERRIIDYWSYYNIPETALDIWQEMKGFQIIVTNVNILNSKVNVSTVLLLLLKSVWFYQTQHTRWYQLPLVKLLCVWICFEVIHKSRVSQAFPISVHLKSHGLSPPMYRLSV